jgi:hypothetical protein
VTAFSPQECAPAGFVERPALFLCGARQQEQLSFNLRLIVEDHVQQGTVDFNVAVVIN